MVWRSLGSEKPVAMVLWLADQQEDFLGC
jgi:hypothetical protein